MEQYVRGEAAGSSCSEIDQARVAPEHRAFVKQRARAVEYRQRFRPPPRAGQLGGLVVDRHHRLGRRPGRQRFESRLRHLRAGPAIQTDGSRLRT